MGDDHASLYDPGCAPDYRLTRRQVEILQCCAEGMMDKEIASALGVTESTIKGHLYRIRRRLGARNTTHAVYTAMRLGLIRA